MTKINSTLGFLFTSEFKQVLLIEKQKPEHHKGLLNGLGGKIEKDESELECIVREVEEESCFVTNAVDWLRFGELHWLEWHVAIFAGVFKSSVDDFKKAPEKVQWYSTKDLPKNLISNLTWLIPMSIDVLKNEPFLLVNLKYC